MLSLTVILGVLIVALIFWFSRRSRDMPPGPLPIPILGNLIQMAWINAKKPYVAMDVLAKRYGDIMTLQLGLDNIVVLSSYDVMKDALHTDEWSGRTWNEALQTRYLEQRVGIIFTEGESWKAIRRFSLRHLRDVGFGKQQSMEFIINEELQELLERFRGSMGDGRQTVLQMHTCFSISVINVLWTLIGGTRYSHDDEKLKSLLDMVDFLFKSGSIGGLSQVYPILRKIAPRFTGENLQLKAFRDIQNFIRKSIQEHRENPSYGNSQDFLDIFLQEIDRTKDDTETFFTDDQLIMLCLDFFLAGSETTRNTLEFAILYMILYPKVQAKVFEEIEDVIGLDEKPTLAHEPQLKYTAAVLMEVQRISNVGPLTPPHSLTSDVVFREYRIPKNTAVMVNLWSVHMNQEHWGDPEVFRPERFLDNEGNLLKDEHLIPFGIGKRNCLGESLARMSLFLYFTTLLQNFKFETVPGHLDPSTEAVLGFTLSPQPYNAVATLRTE